LRHDLIVPDDRPGNKLRKKGDEQGIMREGVLFGQALGAIDEIGYLLKGKKGDPQGQKDVFGVPGAPSEPCKVRHEKICVFEVTDKRKVDCHPAVKPYFAVLSFLHIFFDNSSPGIVEKHRKKDQKDERWVPVGIKNQGCHRKNGDGHIRNALGAGEAKQNPCDGQKDKKKDIRIKKHAYNPPLL